MLTPLLLACGADLTTEAEECREWEDTVWVAVDAETSLCPEPFLVGLHAGHRWEGCEGDEIVAIVDLAAEAPIECDDSLIDCQWACLYHASIRSCVADPVTCWVI